MATINTVDDITHIDGVLEVDHRRGVIYFYAKQTGGTVLRIRLPKRIPRLKPELFDMLDITHMYGTNWGNT